jgi:DNA-binding MarR family transcriptional regulator
MEPKQAQGPSQLSCSAIHLLHRAGQCAGDLFSEEVALGDVTPRQYVVLFAVAQREGLSQTDLVACTGIDRSTLADIVHRMLKKGFLTRRRTRADARLYSVRLTDKGREALEAAELAAKSAEERLLAPLDSDKRRLFLETLSQIVSSNRSNGR